MTQEIGRGRRLRRAFKGFKRVLRYYTVLPAVLVISRLPLPLARALGYLIGTLAWVLSVKDRRQAMENLRAAFGDSKSPRQLGRICRGVFRNTAVNVIELLVVHRWSPEKIRRVFPFGEELRECEKACPQGAVGLTAHFGNWELLGIIIGTFLPGRLAPVAKRIYFEKFQRLVERMRSKASLEVIYTDESPRRLLEALEGGKVLGLLADQDLKVLNGVFVDFFGRPAYTSTTPVNLALASGRPLLFLNLVRKGRGFRFLFHEIPLVRSGDRQADLLENTRRWSKTLEADIRELPDQWVWFHRRWRTRPEDGPRKVRRRNRFVEARPEEGSGAESKTAPGLETPQP